MKKPAIPENEQGRLAALRALGLLDTPPEDRFDRLTRLTQQFFNVEIALITLVDAERQWFKSRQGLEACETTRAGSFCGHAILEEGIFEVPDALEDERFHDNPAVVGPPYIRFYAAAPVSSIDGFRIGTLCIADPDSRRLTGRERQVLIDLAGTVEEEVNNFYEHQLRAKLAVSESRNQAIIDAMPDRVYVVDRSGGILFCQIHPELSLARGAVVGLCQCNVLPHCLEAEYQGAIARTLARAEPCSLDYEVDGGDGPVQLEARFKRLSDDEALILIRDVSHEKAFENALVQQQQVTEAIARSQGYFIRGVEPHRAFDSLLKDTLDLTGSEYGLVAEVSPGRTVGLEPGKTGPEEPCLKMLASTTDSTAVISSLMSLLAPVARAGENRIIASTGPGDSLLVRKAGLATFLGMPIYEDGSLIALLGLANSRNGAMERTPALLRSLLATTGRFIAKSRIEKDNADKQRQIERLSRVASDTTNAVIITDPEGRIEWINEGFTRITGYTLKETLGRKPGDLLQGERSDPATVLQMHKALQAEQPFEVDIVNYTRSGTPYWMHIACNTLRHSSGELQGFIAVQSDVTRQRESEARVRELLERMRKLTSNLPGMIYQYQMWPDGSSCFPYVSEGVSTVFGILPKGLSQDATPMLDRIHRDDQSRVMASIQVSYEDLTLWEARFRLAWPSGDSIWIEGRATPERLDDGSTLWHGFLADISERKHLEQLQQEQTVHTQAILDNVVDGIISIDRFGVINSVNPAAEKIFGYSAAEVLGRNVSILMPGSDRALQVGFARQAQDTDDSRMLGVTREVQATRKDGRAFPMELAISRVRQDGRILYIGVMRDISERKNAEEQINNLAFYDPLTGLPNRRLFYDRLKQARIVCRRSRNHGALLFIDLDNFKRLNDTAGHHTGDQLLKLVAGRLTDSVRETDTVARLGGDEFVVLLESLGDDPISAASYAEMVGEKIRLSLNRPYPEVNPVYEGTSSIGVTLFFDKGESVDELLKQADMAMYQAKAEGRNMLMFFDPHMQADVMAHATMEKELRVAVHEQQFVLFYQVQVDVDGQATGAEALLRWLHPDKGWIRPNEFIPLAEESRLILPIGHWVLRTACRQLVSWSHMPGAEHLTLAVNVSALQLAQPDFVEQVLAVIEETGANPERIKLELTESLLASDIEGVIAKMKALKARGVNFSLDDFGTGYSSLAYLKKMPIEQLKIDQSFVRDILVDQSDSVIAKTIIALARSMGLGVIAEGVETDEHRNLLLEMGCLAYQGYLFGHPMPIAGFEQSHGLDSQRERRSGQPPGPSRDGSSIQAISARRQLL